MRRSRRGEEGGREEGGREGELNEAKNVVKTGLTKAESKPGGEWSFRIERVRISSRGETSITTATHKGWRERKGGGGGGSMEQPYGYSTREKVTLGEGRTSNHIFFLHLTQQLRARLFGLREILKRDHPLNMGMYTCSNKPAPQHNTGQTLTAIPRSASSRFL